MLWSGGTLESFIAERHLGGLMWTWLLRLIPIVGRCSPVVIALIVGAAGGWYVTNQYHEERAQEEALQAAIERAEQGKKVCED